MRVIAGRKELNLMVNKDFSEIENAECLEITKTKVYVSRDGIVMTATPIGDANSDKFYCSLRNVSPVLKKTDVYEYKIYIEHKAHSLHKLVALAYPDMCGYYTGKEVVHHKDLNHLNNAASNLVFLTNDVHKLVHKLIKDNNYDENYIKFINSYFDYCRAEESKPEVNELYWFIDEFWEEP